MNKKQMAAALADAADIPHIKASKLLNILPAAQIPRLPSADQARQEEETRRAAREAPRSRSPPRDLPLHGHFVLVAGRPATTPAGAVTHALRLLTGACWALHRWCPG